jgi:hypothetical protein
MNTLVMNTLTMYTLVDALVVHRLIMNALDMNTVLIMSALWWTVYALKRVKALIMYTLLLLAALHFDALVSTAAIMNGLVYLNPALPRMIAMDRLLLEVKV